jgi:hypothetical protein
MTTIMPKGENVRQSLKWISNERLQDECKDLIALISDASMRFNLSPKEEEFLRCFYADGKPDSLPPED